MLLDRKVDIYYYDITYIDTRKEQNKHAYNFPNLIPDIFNI